jgi:hypothetical protein
MGKRAITRRTCTGTGMPCSSSTAAIPIRPTSANGLCERMEALSRFGRYHPSNLDLIGIAAGNGGSVVLGTVTGIHKSNHELIAGRIANNLKMHVGGVDLHDMKASELLRELRPRILMLAG